jgi:hypothetical protein
MNTEKNRNFNKKSAVSSSVYFLVSSCYPHSLFFPLIKNSRSFSLTSKTPPKILSFSLYPPSPSPKGDGDGDGGVEDNRANENKEDSSFMQSNPKKEMRSEIKSLSPSAAFIPTKAKEEKESQQIKKKKEERTPILQPLGLKNLPPGKEKRLSKSDSTKQNTPWPNLLNGGNEIGQKANRQDIVSITYEEIGFFPRSFSRVLDRFLKQVFSDVEYLVIQEYRFYRYLFLTTLKCVLILFFVPFMVNYFSKTYLVSPLTEYFWNTQQTEIFLNSYQQKRAFTELKDFEEKLYFESLINCGFKTCRFDEVESNSTTNLVKDLQPDFLTNNINSKVGDSFVTTLSTPSFPLALQTLEEKRERGASSSLLITSTKTAQDSSLKSTFFPLQSNPFYKGGALSPSPLGEGGKRRQGKEEKKNFETKEETLFTSSLTVSRSEETVLKEETNKKEVYKKKEQSKSEIIRQTSNRQDAFEQRLQEKTIELAIRYNNQSIEAITNFFADLLSFLTLCYLLIILEIQINITKSFLLEVFFGLDDGKKSLFILLITDLLVGYHSSNLWELFFEFLFNHYGLPESQTGIFLLVATLPVLLDVLFKYLIFRHLNRSSPATVATYHAIIE